MGRTASFALVISLASTAADAADPIPVNPDNFVRAESDLYIGRLVKEAGGIGRLLHHREPASIENQTIVRLNRDTLYSFAIFDLEAGPATITLPDAGGRFMSLQIINEDQYTPNVFYGPGSHTLKRGEVGTRYVVAGVRTLVDPSDRKDVEAVHALQDQIKVEQPGGPGKFEAPNWDQSSQTKVRDALLVLSSTMSGFSQAFGSKDEVNPVHYLIGAAAGWGGNPDKDAKYISVTPAKNDGKTVYKLDVPGDVPVDGFWSVSRYNAKGYYTPNKLNAYSVNNLTAKKGADGSVSIQFGGCENNMPNCLPIDPGWNYTVRLYRPRAAILDGSWSFPEPRAVQ